MRITRILHHSVNVEGNLDDCIRFYRRLSLADTARPEVPGIDGHWFAVERAQVHLVDAPAGDTGIRPTGPHVCFGVEDLAAAVDELERDGVPFVRGRQGEVEQVWVSDPAGNTIELQQDPGTRS